ncbi:MAG TPA: 50S ribosomal protein L22 [Candidatus Paceibacterota bacterium]
MITASLSNTRISPRKVRVVADMIRGKKVTLAKVILQNATKKAKDPIAGLIDSAIANASHNHKIEAENLIVSEIRVDKGYTLKRSIPMSRGSAFPIKKRTSHISVVLAPAPVKKEKKAAPTKTDKTAPTTK